MNSIKYIFGSAKYLDQLFPPAKYANNDLMLRNYPDVIRHYTMNSLKADGFGKIEKKDNKVGYEVKVELINGEYHIQITAKDSLEKLSLFAERHSAIFSADYAQKAIKGKKLLEKLNVWNPMKGYPVNQYPKDADSLWHLFPPLGLNVIAQKGLLLMHYPPWSIIQGGTFENAMTMLRWGQLLSCVGFSTDDVELYKTIIDVNPIAAPGSGESEYPVDYFPIMMAAGFFDSPKRSNRDYIRSMLELYLCPPDWPEKNKYTLPLLICGSELYDPQCPGWFRTAFKDILPKDDYGTPQVQVMQTGTFKLRPDSKRETPYMISNHMIAASVTGKCTEDETKVPNIRQYEAQDLVAAQFLKEYDQDPNINPYKARENAFIKWYGSKEVMKKNNEYISPSPEDEKK